VGAGIGLTLFALVGLLQGSMIGGAIGLGIVNSVLGGPAGPALMSRVIVAASMLAGVTGRAGGVWVGRLLGRTYAETSGVARQALFDAMREIARPFTDALRRALPGVGQIELLWKLHFAVGVMAHTMAGTEHLKFLSGGLCDLTAAGDAAPGRLRHGPGLLPPGPRRLPD
jgi:hypothetical protein